MCEKCHIFVDFPIYTLVYTIKQGLSSCNYVTLFAHKYSIMNLNWHWTALTVYLVICVFDFMVVPMWFGFMRPDYHTFLEEGRMIDDTMIQLELMKKLTQHHSPYTLQMGGLFHLAFGALLTGSAFGVGKK